MEKKKYIKPAIKVYTLDCNCAILTVSGGDVPKKGTNENWRTGDTDWDEFGE